MTALLAPTIKSYADHGNAFFLHVGPFFGANVFNGRLCKQAHPLALFQLWATWLDLNLDYNLHEVMDNSFVCGYVCDPRLKVLPGVSSMLILVRALLCFCLIKVLFALSLFLNTWPYGYPSIWMCSFFPSFPFQQFRGFSYFLYFIQALCNYL